MINILRSVLEVTTLPRSCFCCCERSIGSCKRSPPPWVPVPGVSGTDWSSTMNVHSAADGRDHLLRALWLLAA